MKKFFMMAVMAVCALAANAQTPAAGSITVTPKVGINASTYSGDIAEPKMKIGFTAGAEALYMFDDMLGVSAGIMYSQQGAKSETGSITNTLKADYINIPILAQSYLAPGFAVKLGVQPGFKVNESLKHDGGNASVEGEVKWHESFDLAIPIGVSYEFSNVVLDARYNWSVTDCHKAEKVKAHHNVFQFTVGYRF